MTYKNNGSGEIRDFGILPEDSEYLSKKALNKLRIRKKKPS